MLQLKQWKRGSTIFCEVCKLGACDELARRIADHADSWWRGSNMGINIIMPIAYFDRLGVPRFS